MSAAILPINEPRSMLSYAKRYIARGWWVLPLLPGTKQPFARLAPNGVHSATNDIEVALRWWAAEPEAGIGVACMKSGLVVVDVDPRNGGFETMERLEAEHGPLASDVLAFTGGGGEHRVFSSQLVNNLPGKLGPGVDLKADGYICVEPTVHPNGRPYQWEASSDPLQGATPSTLPGWVRDLSRGPFGAAASIPAVRMVDARQISDLRSALAVLSSDDYHQWVNFGNALVELGQAGFNLWDEWSQRSAKYDQQAATRKWRSFKSGACQIESIFFEAQRAGWVNPMTLPDLPAPVPVAEVKIAPAPAVKPTPANLLSPPGMLGTVTEWINATARKPQPAFAVQGAIAFCCAVLGRRFVTTQRNWPSLYLLNIGKSSSGKEHAKWAVEQLLEACDMSTLIGPASYTSSAGLLSALHDQPSHLTIIDEFGKELEMASVKGNARAQSTLRSLIEVWGRCDGTLRPQGYSTFGMSSADASKIKDRSVRNPALSLLAMTTPDTFFDTIGSAAARDGFLNRFLIVESDIGRQASSMAPKLDVPAEVVDWARAMHAASDGLVNPGVNPSVSPTPFEVEISREALELFRHFDAECIGHMDEHDTAGMAEMWGRTNETAMRLALVVAVGCANALPITVEGPHAAWAIQYARHHAQRTVERLISTVADSEFAATKKQILALIRKAGERGRTVAELSDSSRRFECVPKRQQMELLDSLQYVGQIRLVDIPSLSGRGKARQAWVAVEREADE